MIGEGPLKVLVLAGGPDRERPVSLESGRTIAVGLAEAGHEVVLRDATPEDLWALDEWLERGGEVVFPILHGRWGEGGPLQDILTERGVPYVGCRGPAARLCMDKQRTKEVLLEHGLSTPRYEVVERGRLRSLWSPLVIKPLDEGSSLDVVICREEGRVDAELDRLAGAYPRLLLEQFVAGKELTVGIVEDLEGRRVLPPIQILPSTPFYDYEAKYHRDDTRYLVGFEAIDLPLVVLEEACAVARGAYEALGCRHMGRVDLIVDDEGRPWILEINTSPGFTSHSLLPKAAAHAGVGLARLVDGLVRLAYRENGSSGA